MISDKNEHNSTPNNSCEIWAVGGGKGGTGKSLVTSSMGTYLASKGKKVIMIDADLGGANLHSFLGVKKPSSCLSDFFENGVPLKDLIKHYGNGHNNIGLVSGDVNSLDSDKLKYTQKLKLFRHIKSLEADHVIIDLGAGSHHTAMDAFLLADKMVVVVLPEITSVENMYQFVKSALFRKLNISFTSMGMKYIFNKVWQNRKNLDIKNIREFIDHLRKSSTESKNIIDEAIKSFEINIIVNQSRNEEDINVGRSIRSVFHKYLGLKSNYLGYIEYDDAAWNAVRKREPLLHAYPSSSSAAEIRSITDILTNKSLS